MKARLGARVWISESGLSHPRVPTVTGCRRPAPSVQAVSTNERLRDDGLASGRARPGVLQNPCSKGERRLAAATPGEVAGMGHQARCGAGPVDPDVGIVGAGRSRGRWYRAKGLTREATVQRVEQPPSR